jgi:molybdopterin converting factor small subunit
MKVDLYGVYRLYTGQKTLECDMPPDCSIQDLLDWVTAQVPALRDELLDAHGNVYPYIPIYLNGRNPRLLEGGFDRAVRPEDVLSIFSPISSGKINVEEAR